MAYIPGRTNRQDSALQDRTLEPEHLVLGCGCGCGCLFNKRRQVVSGLETTVGCQSRFGEGKGAISGLVGAQESAFTACWQRVDERAEREPPSTSLFSLLLPQPSGTVVCCHWKTRLTR